MKETVVVFYSRSGKTRWVAEQLAKTLDADVEEIVEAKSRAGILGWLSGGRDAAFKRAGELTSAHVIEGRKTIIIGTPVWAGGPAPAVLGYLARYNLAGKRLCAFCTFDGSEGHCFDRISKAAKMPLAATLGLKKPRADEAKAVKQIEEWTATLK